MNIDPIDESHIEHPGERVSNPRKDAAVRAARDEEGERRSVSQVVHDVLESLTPHDSADDSGDDRD